MSEDIRPFEVNVYNPSIHELVDDSGVQPSGLRKFVAAGLLVLTGFGVYNGTQSSEAGVIDPDVPVPALLAPEVATPEIAQVNLALTEIKLGQPNNLDNLIAAVKSADATFAPSDKDRLPDMPAGYVKMLLPHEATGISVPYTIAERTSDNERYTSPEVAAGMLAAAKLYQDLIIAKYPHLQGEMLRLRDFNSPHHKSHHNATHVDFAGAFGWGITHYSNGSMGDKQFSDRYSPDFTVDMAVELAGLRIAGQPAISSILFSDSGVNQTVNNRVGRDFMRSQKYHLDHFHATFAVGALPQWRPAVEELPWSGDQDLRIGGMAQSISPEQRNSQHKDFELWLVGRMGYMAQLLAQDNLKAPEGFTPEQLSPVAEAHIAQLDIPEERKNFLRNMVPSIVSVYRAGAKINPSVVLAQTSLETGFGQSKLSDEVNNYFGMKAGTKWKDDVYIAETLEEYTEGNPETIVDSFRAYPNAASSVADYARLINTAPHYADASVNYQSILGYTNGLFNEVDSQGNIVREQGEPGVLSYGTDRGYEQKVFEMIELYGYESLINAQING